MWNLRKITLVPLLMVAVAVSCTVSSDQGAVDKAVSATLPADQPASAITHPPADMSNVNGMHDILRSEEAYIRFGTQADPSTVTLGPTAGGILDYPPHTKARTVLTLKCR